MTANAFAAIPDFSSRAPVALRPPSPVRSILADLEAQGLRVDITSACDALALSDALAAASARLAQIARKPDIQTSGRFALTQIRAGRYSLQHDGRRIADVHAPDAFNDRWSIYVTLRVDEALPAPLRWYITHFDSLDSLKDFLGIADQV